MSARRQVAVIGAGFSGLCCLRHLSKHPERFELTCYEQAEKLGGTWVYTDKTERDEERGLQIHSSMYKNLRVNIPKHIMCFPDFPFKDSLPTFPHHTDVLDYLNEYTKHYQLHKYINYNSEVMTVRPFFSPSNGSTGNQWEVKVRDILSGQEVKSLFDVVLVCTGKFFKPYCDINGLQYFKGTVVHSHNYRVPELFRGQRVLVIGAGESGTDISLEVAKTAKEVIVSHAGSMKKRYKILPANMRDVSRVSVVKECGSILLEDGSIIPNDAVDAIIPCTGYEYEFPFLSPECCIGITDHRVHPLYKHMINTKYPSMAFIGLNYRIIPSAVVESQVRYCLSVLLGKTKLPSKEEMELDGDEDYRWRLGNGFKVRDAHSLAGELQWAYTDHLAQAGGFEPVKVFVREVAKFITQQRMCNIKYREVEIELTDDEKWKVISGAM